MVSIDLDRLETAITAISRLAEGRNPVTGEQTEYLSLEDPKVIRCLYSAEKIMSEVLRGLAEENDGMTLAAAGRKAESNGMVPVESMLAAAGRKAESNGMISVESMQAAAAGEKDVSGKAQTVPAGEKDAAGMERQPAEDGSEITAKKKKVPFPFEILSLFIYREDKSITHLLRQFAEPAGDRNIKLPNAAAIHRWFGENGYLVKEALEPGGQEFWMPTQKGSELGLYTREGMFRGRQIVSVMFNEPAQYFLAGNLEKIVRDIQA